MNIMKKERDLCVCVCDLKMIFNENLPNNGHR